jgi:hypothetical protein
MSIFTKGRQGLNLTPAERALLKLVEGFVVAGIVAALPVLSMLLGQANVDWTAIGRIALGTFATAALMAAVKYLKAQRDMPLAEPIAAVLTGAAQQVAARTGLNDAKTGVVWPSLSGAPSPDATVTTTINGATFTQGN